MAKILNQFSHSYQVHSEGRRRLNEKINSCPEGVCPIKKIESAQNFIFSRIKELNSKEVVIDCESYRNKKLYINQFGKISYCFTHAEFEDDYLNDMNKIDYKKIKEYNYYDCFLCSKESRMYMNKLKFNFIC